MEAKSLFLERWQSFFANGTERIVPLHKVGGLGHGFFTRSEGVLLKSSNLLSERDPAKIAWETLPDGRFRADRPAGRRTDCRRAELLHFERWLFLLCYRTIDGHPACALQPRSAAITWVASRATAVCRQDG